MLRKLYLALVALMVVAGSAAASGNRVVVSKQRLRLAVIDSRGDTLMDVPCAVGAALGQKRISGDMKTPEGTFEVSQIQDSRKWTHDFGDGAGKRRGAYGPWFVRLAVPGATGIGIHGTCFPESMGTRSSEGCVRLLDRDVERLVGLIGVGTEVTICPDYDVLIEWIGPPELRTLVPASVVPDTLRIHYIPEKKRVSRH